MSRRHTKVVALAMAAAMSMILGSCGCSGTASDSPATETTPGSSAGTGTVSRATSIAVGSSTVTVEAPQSAGEITGEEVADATVQPDFATFLSEPVHLSASGTLSAPATISFPIDTSLLPAGIAPDSGFVSIYTRGPQTGGVWDLKGGAYDAAAGTISVTTEHFSDWAVAYTDFDKIARQIAASDRDGLGLSLVHTVSGNPPPLTCSAEDIPLTYAITPGFESRLDVCLVQDHATHDYELQVVNKDAVPFVLTLPNGLEVVPDEEAESQGFALDVIAGLRSALDQQTVVLPAEQSLTFAAPNGQIERDALIIADIAWDYMAADLALGLLDIATFDSRLVKTGFESIQKSKRAGQVSDAREILDCMSANAETFKAIAQGDEEASKRNILKVAYEALKCMPSLVDSYAVDLLSQVHDEGVVSTFVSRVKSLPGLSDVLDLKDYVADTSAFLRRDLLGTINLLGSIAGADMTVGLRLRSVKPAESLLDLLPTDRTSDGNSREYEPVSQDYGLPGECGVGIDPSNMVPYPFSDPAEAQFYPNAIGRATTSYLLPRDNPAGGTGEIYVRIMQIRPERVEAAISELLALPVDACSGTNTVDQQTPTVYQPLDPPFSALATIRTYDVQGFAGSGSAFEYFAISGPWLLDLTLAYDPLTLSVSDAKTAFDEEVFRQSVRMDDQLGNTSFSG